MATFVLLITFTSEGIHAIPQSVDRANAFEKMVIQHGGKLCDLLRRKPLFV